MNANRKVGFFSAIKSVFAAFFGVQSDQTREQDFASGKPHHFIIAGILATCIFIAVVLFLVKFAMRSLTT